MPKWKKDTKEFEVGVNYVENRGASSSIPKPIIEMLGNPQSIKFLVNEDNEVVLVSGNTSIDNKIKYVNKK
jgi:uncharacterized protein YcgL (UPF0745 family)